MARHDGRPRNLPEVTGECYFQKGECPFHGVVHEFEEKESE